jgi:5-methyltetrahydrofolate--homocysteine methyltransferase
VKKIEFIDQKEALRYLGYVGNDPEDNIQKILDVAEKQVLDVIEPRYIYKCFDIDSITDKVVLDNCKLELVGNDIVNHLKGCTKVILMCATLSINVDRFIRVTQITDMTKAVIIDSLASVAIENVCDNIQEEIQQEYNKYFQTYRFSPGYGDFPIEIQKDFLTVLDAPKKIGLTTTEDNILTPKKSVTAVIGLSESQIVREKRGCQSCNMKNNCMYRRKGERCGF